MGLIQSGNRLTPAVLNRLGPIAARKGASETLAATTTYQDDNELFVTVEAGAAYQAHLHLVYTGVTAAGLRLRLTVPSGASAPAWTLSVTAGTMIDLNMDTGTAGIAASGGTDTLDGWGSVLVGGTAGTVRVQWAQSTSNAGNTAVNSTSFLVLHRLS